MVNALADRAVGSFAGVGNPFSLRPLTSGERVVAVGSGAGFDSFIAGGNGLDRFTASRFVPVALEVSIGGVALAGLLINRRLQPMPRSRPGPSRSRGKVAAAKAPRRSVPIETRDPAGRSVRDRLARLAPRLGLAFVVWLSVTALTADRPSLSFLGLYSWGTGALFSAGLIGAWALGRAPGGCGRHVEDGLLAVVLLNAAEATLQSFGVDAFGIASFAGRADGFLRNPVYLARPAGRWLVDRRSPLRAGSGVVVGGSGSPRRCRRPGSRGRSAVGLLAVDGVASLFALGLRRAAPVIGASAAGVILITVLGAGTATATGTARLAAGGGGFASRVDNWRGGLRAVADQPILGAGPGRYRAATSRYRTLR